jgi:hypothetical protein
MVIVDVSRFYSTETSYTFCNLWLHKSRLITMVATEIK